MSSEHVFKAVADHHRRQLLDLLAQRDGQTLSELCAPIPMSRFGVMKHLRILEEAGLISTRKEGREKRHYLQSAPLQVVVDWASPYVRLREESMDRLEEYLQRQPADRRREGQAQAKSQDPDPADETGS
jgi:predicted transcriptional regulator